MDVRLYSSDNTELELKEHIEDGIDFNLDKAKSLDEESVVDESELEDSYIDAEEDLDEDSIFDSSLSDDADDLMIFDNDLAEDNIENERDEFDEGGEF